MELSILAMSLGLFMLMTVSAANNSTCDLATQKCPCDPETDWSVCYDAVKTALVTCDEKTKLWVYNANGCPGGCTWFESGPDDWTVDCVCEMNCSLLSV